jgi:hypothetical protein
LNKITSQAALLIAYSSPWKVRERAAHTEIIITIITTKTTTKIITRRFKLNAIMNIV